MASMNRERDGSLDFHGLLDRQGDISGRGDGLGVIKEAAFHVGFRLIEFDGKWVPSDFHTATSLVDA